MATWNRNTMENKPPKEKAPSIVDLLKTICEKLDELIELNTPADDTDDA